MQIDEPLPMIARVKANLLFNSWQGAVVIARAGEGLEHLRKVFRNLKEIVLLSCQSKDVSVQPARDPTNYSENGAPATRSAKFGDVKPSTYRIPKSRRMLSIVVIGF